MSEEMSTERAIEILTPTHRENYDSLETVNTACWKGVRALEKRIPASPYPDGDRSVLSCPFCGNGNYLHNEDGEEMDFCGHCGQAILWEE